MPTIVVGAPKLEHVVPYSRVNVLDRSPDAVSAQSVRRSIGKLPVLVLDEPPEVAAMPFTVSAPPVGAVTSGVTVKVELACSPALLVAVTLCAPEAPTAPDQL